MTGARVTMLGRGARRGWGIGAGLLLATVVWAAAGPDAGAFSFFVSEVRLDEGDLRQVSTGEVITRTVGGDRREVVVFAAGALAVSLDEYIERTDDVERLWRGPYVPQIGRFSSPPRMEDLAELTLDESDLRDITDCRPSDCGIKLAPAEIARFLALGQKGGLARSSEVERELKRVIVERMSAYHTLGLSGIQPYGKLDEPVDVAEVFSSLLQRSTSLPEHVPEIVTYLRRYPKTPTGDFTSVFYWVKQDFGYKPVIAAFHLVKTECEIAGTRMVVSVSKQLFATHYFDGALAVSVYAPEADRAHRGQLVHLHRTVVDLPLMWLLRPFVERGAANKGREVFALMCERIERDGAWRR